MLAIAAAIAGLTAVSGTGAFHGPALARAATGGTFADVSFIDARNAWALVTGCKARNPPCTRVETTSDGGRTWRSLTALPACTSAGPGCTQGRPVVTGLRRIGAQVGFALGTPSFITTDGGRTWRRLARAPIESVAPIDGVVYALTFSTSGCPAECDVALRRAAIGSSSFTLVRSFRNPSLGFGDALAGSGRNLYAVGYGHTAGGAQNAYSRVAISRDAGRTWSLRGDPCRLPGAREIDTTQVVAAGNDVALLCVPRGVVGSDSLLLSGDAGRSFTRLRQPVGDASQIALDARGDLAVANGVTSGTGSYRYRLALSSDRGRTWRMAYDRRARVGATQPPATLQLFGASVRWVIDSRTLLRSDDAGRTWQSSTAP